MAASSALECVAYMVGPEGSGKSTLVLQLQALLARQRVLRLQEELVVAPTTGQEVTALELPPIATIVGWVSQIKESERGALKEGDVSLAATASSGTAVFQPIVAPNDSLKGDGVSSPFQAPPVASRPPTGLPRRSLLVAAATGPPTSLLTMQLRELGGRMASSWLKFIATAAAKTSSSVSAVVFVVDASSTWQIPLAAMEFLSLLSEPSLSSLTNTRFALVVNKSALPVFGSSTQPRMSEHDLVEAFLQPLDVSAACRVDVMWVDTWLGLGLIDVLLWLRNAVHEL